jgi:phospholipid/cholesterol/gamma-HCH transport system substrate-binding protein
VAIAGVTVGQVRDIELDDRLRARVTLEVEKNLALPVDSSAAIQTQGLLGDQFIALEPAARGPAQERRRDRVHRERGVGRAG